MFRTVVILTAVLVATQFFLAGWGAFDRDHSAYDPHQVLGYVIAGFSVVPLLVALLARLGGRIVGMTAALLVLAGPTQPLLARAGDDSGAVWGALHGLVGAFILGLTAGLIYFGGGTARQPS